MGAVVTGAVVTGTVVTGTVVTGTVVITAVVETAVFTAVVTGAVVETAVVVAAVVLTAEVTGAVVVTPSGLFVVVGEVDEVDETEGVETAGSVVVPLGFWAVVVTLSPQATNTSDAISIRQRQRNTRFINISLSFEVI